MAGAGGQRCGEGSLTPYLVPRFKEMRFVLWAKQKMISSWLLTCTLMYRLMSKEMDWKGGACTCRSRFHQFQAFWCLSLAK